MSALWGTFCILILTSNNKSNWTVKLNNYRLMFTWFNLYLACLNVLTTLMKEQNACFWLFQTFPVEVYYIFETHHLVHRYVMLLEQNGNAHLLKSYTLAKLQFRLFWQEASTCLQILFFSLSRPGKTRFREKWLKDIIESKIRMMDMVRF